MEQIQDGTFMITIKREMLDGLKRKYNAVKITSDKTYIYIKFNKVQKKKIIGKVLNRETGEFEPGGI